jgi:hypothetical protein
MDGHKRICIVQYKNIREATITITAYQGFQDAYDFFQIPPD